MKSCLRDDPAAQRREYLQYCSSAKAGRGRPIAGSGGGSATAGVILTKWIDGRVKAA